MSEKRHTVFNLLYRWHVWFFLLASIYQRILKMWLRVMTRCLKKFFNAALDRGIYFAPSKYEAGFISSTHDQSILDLTKDKIEEAIKEL
jgi:glutamate-1-semialdehyde aminotransferase